MELFCRTGGGSGGIVAKDALGNDIKVSDYLKTHQPRDYSLSQGIKVRSEAILLGVSNPMPAPVLRSRKC